MGDKQKKERRVPKLRFPGFTDEWEQRKLNDVMNCVTDYVAAGSFADIRNNVIYYDKSSYAQLVRTVDLKKQFANSDFVYVDKNAFEYLWRVNLNEECIILPNIGANIGEVYYIKPSELPHDNNVLGPNAILLKTNEDNYFVYTSLMTENFQTQLFENVGSSGQPKFNKTELKMINMTLPSIREQERIGAYFSMLDNLITLHLRKCDETKALKKYMLQKMLPKNGMNVPEIRFAGFTNAWEQRKLGDYCDMHNGDRSSKYPNAQDMVSDGIPFINAGDLENGRVNLITANKITQEKYDDLGGAKLQMGDIVYCLRGTLGKNAYIDNFKEGTIASSLVAIRPKNINGRYLFHVLNSDIEYHQRVVHDEGAAQPNLSAKSVSEFAMPVPDIEEQNRIASYFDNFDHLITLHQRKLTHLKELKKGLLQQMFV